MSGLFLRDLPGDSITCITSGIFFTTLGETLMGVGTSVGMLCTMTGSGLILTSTLAGWLAMSGWSFCSRVAELFRRAGLVGGTTDWTGWRDPPFFPLFPLTTPEESSSSKMDWTFSLSDCPPSNALFSML